MSRFRDSVFMTYFCRWNIGMELLLLSGQWFLRLAPTGVVKITH